MIEQLINLAPWIVVLVVYVGEKIQQFKKDRDFDAALRRAQEAAHGAIVPASVPVAPSPSPSSGPAHVPAPTDQKAVVLDQAMVDFVKRQEGYAPKAKWDYKQYTNGYGTQALSADETISEAEAEHRLTAELGKALTIVQGFVPTNTPVGVEQALTDATFNLGTAWMKAGLGTAVKAGDWAAAKEHLLQYNHAGGQVLEGLTKRRQAEVAMFDNPL